MKRKGSEKNVTIIEPLPSTPECVGLHQWKPDGNGDLKCWVCGLPRAELARRKKFGEKK